MSNCYNTGAYSKICAVLEAESNTTPWRVLFGIKKQKAGSYLGEILNYYSVRITVCNISFIKQGQTFTPNYISFVLLVPFHSRFTTIQFKHSWSKLRNSCVT